VIEFVDLAAQRRRIEADLQARLARVFAHGRYIDGPEVAELESRLASEAGATHCIACGNGTDALTIALLALGVGPGREVVTPAFSYIAAAEAIALVGATPVFVDIDPTTYTLDIRAIDRAMSPRTAAIIPVSLFGQCADYEAIDAVAAKAGIPVIEDAAQSFGAKRHSRPSCGLSRIACTSFFPSKPLGCYGDGGAVFTSDAGLATIIRQISRHGQAGRFEHLRVGMNSRLDTLQAAVLLAKLEVFQDELAARRKVAAMYHDLLADLPEVVRPTVAEGNQSVWAQYTVRVPARDAIAAELKSRGIPTAIYYARTIPEQPAFGGITGKFPAAEQAARAVISLPMHPYLTADQQQTIVAGLQEAIGAAHAVGSAA
jgi:UDP-2-acetamido-2-deoxy-ribo-hexuluronate aminotransferase